MHEGITNPEVRNTSAKSRFGLVALGVTGTIVAGLFVGTLPFLTPALRRICLPYVPATNTQIQNILQMCKGRSGHLVDLGSGDGRVVRDIPTFQGCGVIFSYIVHMDGQNFESAPFTPG